MAPKDNENANARPSRISTRAKPPSSTSATTGLASTTEAVTRATGATASSKAKTIAASVDPKIMTSAKRKREALGEVTSLVTNNRLRPLVGKGKVREEKFDGVVLNKTKVSVSRQPLRTVAGTRQGAKASIVAARVESLEAVTEHIDVRRGRDENAMVVDPPQRLPGLTVRRSSVKVPDVGSKAAMHNRISSVSGVPVRQEKDEEEANRACKKVRTSSEPPEEEPPAVNTAQLHANEEEATAKIAAQFEANFQEVEADPDGPDWEDLDADDIDDPLMVSEYVNEIFDYMKQLEVRETLLLIRCL